MTQAYVFANNHETVCEICINRSCSKTEILLRRTDTFGPVCFIYAFLSPISKAETLKRTLLQTDNFFQSSDKKITCLTPTRIKLDIFVKFLKENIFYTLKQPTKSCFVSLKARSDRDLQTMHTSVYYWFQYSDLH